MKQIEKKNRKFVVCSVRQQQQANEKEFVKREISSFCCVAINEFRLFNDKHIFICFNGGGILTVK